MTTKARRRDPSAGRREEDLMIDEIRIRDWLAAYRHAWTTDDKQEVARLFTDDVRYFTAPYREPLSGPDQVADYWVGEGESQVPWSFEYQVLAQQDDMFIVRAVTTYPEGTGEGEGAEVFHNLWLVTLDGDRASEFIEYFMLVE
jgi:ketosteroid isomerase-like protein